MISGMDLGVAVMAFATSEVEFLSSDGIKPTLRTLSLAAISSTISTKGSAEIFAVFVGLTSGEPGVRGIGTNIHPLALLQLNQIHQEAESQLRYNQSTHREA
jgi:hypothetical protein